MKIDKNLTTKLAYTTNIVNTVGGGMVETNTSFRKEEDQIVININVPGISPDNLNVEINNDLVLVFLNMENLGKEPFNYLMKFYKIPNGVDSELIWADYQKGLLSVIMPFKELTGGYFREVKISS